MSIWIFIFILFLIMFIGIFICFLVFIKNFFFNKNLSVINKDLKNNLIYKYENKNTKKLLTTLLVSELALERITQKNIDKNFTSDIYLTDKYIILIINCCILRTFEYKNINKILRYLSGKNMCISILDKSNQSSLLLSVPTNDDKLKDKAINLINLILNKNDKIISCKDNYDNEIK